MGTDRLDRWTKILMVLTILAVAVFAFVQSYTHLYVLGWTHHQTGTANRMFPLSVDWVMFAAGLAMLHLGRKGIRHPLPRSALALGATATLVANIASGIIWGWESALIAAWAPVGLFIVVELGMLLVRTAHAKPPVPAYVRQLPDFGKPHKATPEEMAYWTGVNEEMKAGHPEPVIHRFDGELTPRQLAEIREKLGEAAHETGLVASGDNHSGDGRRDPDSAHAVGAAPAPVEAVTASPEEALSGWGQLGGQEPAKPGLEGIGLANGRK